MFSITHFSKANTLVTFSALLSLVLLSLQVFAQQTPYEEPFFSIVNHKEPMQQGDNSHRAKRIEAISETLLGAKYEDGSLGEGAHGVYDTDPLIRFDVFDCTTYVEAVVAGAMSQSKATFEKNLKQLRYKNGQVEFIYRNHFPSLDWIPNNQDKLTDITHLVAPDDVQLAQATIDKPSWYKNMKANRLKCESEHSLSCKQRLAQLQQEGRHFQPENSTIAYVPLSAIYLKEDKLKESKSKEGESKDVNGNSINHRILDRIPSGSVISMVRPNWNIKKWIGTNMNVSHQSIAIRKGDRLYLRHASQTHKHVIDEDFITYFSKYLDNSSLKGFNVLVLKDRQY
ncbi:N-acetylmuramoyl-L-alanine amidase-like domain-containing protein [Marinomonas mediterranea]|uniref:N-acetylmuramoyl-L-alanine amidase-like domain-containing protein n=1 Tax=Marinomonas mediterranea TaxID=119864 RepID=UPI00234AED98|nr:N-acetylmuramoyl-L-alanine amidase-like domain-containing protein [Marinomonas mediterranea]WCN09801.1 DUF1460 domain-containing protein [Marinomonas mediterranea]